jgi:hypothetical protein
MFTWNTMRDINHRELCCEAMKQGLVYDKSTPRQYSTCLCMHRSQRFCHFLDVSWKSCSVRVFIIACDSASITSIMSKWRPFSCIFSRRNRKVAADQVRRVGWVGFDSHVVFGKKLPSWKQAWDSAFPWCNSQFFCHKSSSKVWAHFHPVTAKSLSSMRNWLFFLLGEARPWLCSSFVSPFSVYPGPSVPFSHLCTAHAFFPERLSNHYQGVRRTFPEIYTKCDAVPLSDPSRNHVRQDTWLQINGRKN